eukprot:s995_g15.t1
MFTLLSICATVVCLLLFCLLRRVRRKKRDDDDWTSSQPDLDLGEEVEELPEHVLKSFTFWAGGLAGVVSAAATHQLDVAKTLLGRMKDGR